MHSCISGMGCLWSKNHRVLMKRVESISIIMREEYVKDGLRVSLIIDLFWVTSDNFVSACADSV